MNIAMIGGGGIAARHLGVLAGREDVRIVGHVTRTRESREAAARTWGGRPYGSVEALLDGEQVDAAWITVPPHAHDGIEEALIAHEVPFLVEKPLSADRDTAERIGARLRERGLLAAVGYQLRALDVLPEVRRRLAAHAPRMVVGAWHGELPPPAWWRRQEKSGGQMVEQATHLFDLARYLLGEADVLHAAEGHHHRPGAPDADVAAVASATLRFAAGPLGTFTAVNVLPAAHEVRLALLCDGLAITITRDAAIFDDGHERRELRSRSDAIARQNDAFLQAVREGRPELVQSAYEDALRTHRLTFDVLEAARAAR